MTDLATTELSLALEKLEYGSIKDRLAAECLFGVSAELSAALEPSPDRWLVDRWLEATAEGVDLLANFPDITIGGARDIRSGSSTNPRSTYERKTEVDHCRNFVAFAELTR